MVYLHNSYSSPSVDGTRVLYDKLREFKFIYVLYFRANILQMLGKLSKIFKCMLRDISCLWSNAYGIVKNEIATIRMHFLLDVCDLNQDTLNPSLGFHVIPEFGPRCGFLRHLSSEIKGSKFHSVDMIRDPSGTDLEIVVFSKVICSSSL